jgi:hypothetical protein
MATKRGCRKKGRVAPSKRGGKCGKKLKKKRTSKKRRKKR